MPQKKETTQSRLKYLMTTRKIKQIDILNLCEPYCLQYGVKMNKSDLSQYVSGKVEPSQSKLVVLGMALNVSEGWLMGFNVPMERTSNRTSEIDVNYTKYDNIIPITTKKFPLLGEIASGEPIFADEDHESYIAADSDIKADFALRCKGDSMINARIMDGDIVFIRQQPQVENGEIAAVIIEDSATLKRVYYYKERDMLILKAENNQYEDFIYTGSELNSVKILGKAIAFQSDVR
jgi:repressor LexA